METNVNIRVAETKATQTLVGLYEHILKSDGKEAAIKKIAKIAVLAANGEANMLADIIKKSLFYSDSTPASSRLDNELFNILNKYPIDAISWSQADDRIRDLARKVREIYNELVLDVTEGDPGYVYPLDFRIYKSPAQWNTNAKSFILKFWAMMDDRAKENVLH